MKTGHFYFGKNRTFLNWLDIDRERSCSLLKILLYSVGLIEVHTGENIVGLNSFRL